MNKDEKKTLKELYDRFTAAGQRTSDRVTSFIGSWIFIFLFIFFVIIWISINIYGLLNQFDPFPFILLNLTLSCLAAIQAPLIMMSQNREMDRDRERMELDYWVNRRAEKEITEIKEDLDDLKQLIRKQTVEGRKRGRG